jgi:hypothetical protein
VDADTDDEDDREFEPGGEKEGVLVGVSLGERHLGYCRSGTHSTFYDRGYG